MDKVTSVLIVGVGGQGVILASEILSEVALEGGMDVKKSEVHGMAQRGGAVSSHVRFGSKVYSPLIGVGEADVILAFEALEAVRWAYYARADAALYEAKNTGRGRYVVADDTTDAKAING